MALKDLIASKTVMNEAVIEEIIKDYIRYDEREKAVHFTPAAAHLPVKAKILIYLTALQGWTYITKEKMETGVKPALLESELNIQGGTLRPNLKDLKDRHFLMKQDGKYAIKSSGLEAIRKELQKGQNPDLSRNQQIRKPKKAKASQAKKATSKTKRSKAAEGLKDVFQGLIEEGFFKQAKSLSDLQGRLHEEGRIVSQTTLPRYLLHAVTKTKQLARKKVQIGNKTVWAYQNRATASLNARSDPQ